MAATFISFTTEAIGKWNFLVCRGSWWLTNISGTEKELRGNAVRGDALRGPIGCRSPRPPRAVHPHHRRAALSWLHLTLPSFIITHHYCFNGTSLPQSIIASLLAFLLPFGTTRHEQVFCYCHMDKSGFNWNEYKMFRSKPQYWLGEFMLFKLIDKKNSIQSIQL